MHLWLMEQEVWAPTLWYSPLVLCFVVYIYLMLWRAFTMLMHQVVRWRPHMIGGRKQTSGIRQIDSCNQSESFIKFRCLVLHTYSILDPECMMPLEFPNLWFSWNAIRLGLLNPIESSYVECGWPRKPSGWSIRLFWVSVSIWTLSSTLYVNYVVVFLALEVELNLSYYKHSIHTNTSRLFLHINNELISWGTLLGLGNKVASI